MKNINDQGFTLIEALISLAAFLIIVSFIPLTFKIISVNENMDERKQVLEWHVFIQQLKKEVRIADEMFIDERERLVLIIENKQISYEKYNDKLRRQVNGAGHEVVLQKLKSVQFKQEEERVTMIYRSIFEQAYTASFYQMQIVEKKNGDE